MIYTLIISREGGLNENDPETFIAEVYDGTMTPAGAGIFFDSGQGDTAAEAASRAVANSISDSQVD